MAGNVSKVYIEVEVDGKGGIKVLREVGSESDKAGKTGSKSFREMDKSVETLNSHLSTLKKLGGTLFAGWGIKRVFGEMQDMVRLSEDQRKAVAGMEAAMRSMGRYTPDMSEKMQDLASQMEAVTNYGEDATLQGIKFLTTYQQISNDLLPESIKTMADLAALMGGDMTQAANMLGKASMGMTGELRRVGITVDQMTFKLYGYKGVLKEIQSQVGGQAAAMRDPWHQLSNYIGDAKRNLGGFIGFAFEDYANDMITLLQKLNRLWKDVAASIDNTRAVEERYHVESLMRQLASKKYETGPEIAGLGAPFTITGMPGQEERLKEEMKQYEKVMHDISDPKTWTFLNKPGTGAPAPTNYWNTLEGKTAMSLALANVQKNAHEEWRLRSKYSELTAADSATFEKQMADFKNAQGLAALEEWINRQKIMEMRFKESNDYMVMFSRHTAESMEQNFSDFYFDVMTGKFRSLGDYARAIFESIARAEADILGQMTREALFGKQSSSSSGGLFSLGFSAITSLFAPSYPGAGTYGVTPGSINWHAQGGSFGPYEWIGVGEKGPEIIYTGNKSGQVVPTGGAARTPGEPAPSGGVYFGDIHIHAVDARSFASLVQRDPHLIGSVLLRGLEQNPSYRRRLRGVLR